VRRAVCLSLALPVAAVLALAPGAVAHDGHPTTAHTLVGDDPERGYAQLRIGPGEPYTVRDDLARPRDGRAQRRRSLIYLAQLSDFQISDEESPARVEFLDRDPSGFASSAWRPQEAMVAHQVNETVKQVNRLLDSPVAQGDGTRARMLNAVLTGDQADNQQLNEHQWVLRLLEGGPIDPGSGTQDVGHPLCPPGGAGVRDFDDPSRYTGVQDHTDYLGDSHFWDPNMPAGLYATRGWPTLPGLMDRAQQPFAAEGLRVPSYVAFGNHDTLLQGNQWANSSFAMIATGCVKPLASLDPFSDPAALLARAIAEPDKFMLVPRDERRRIIDKREIKRLHEPGQGDAHGFAFVDPDELRASAGAAAYYAFTPRAGIRYIVLDTVSQGGIAGDSANGNIDNPQFEWLERELGAAQQRNELILVFGHHSLGSLTSSTPDEAAPPCLADPDPNPGCDRDPRPSTPIRQGSDLRALLHRFPNVVAFAAGHSHENRVAPVPRTGGGGFWEIKSPAVVDWPTQHRLIEVMDNRDGTLSIFGTMADHGGSAESVSGGDASGLTPEQLAALGRTVAYNDPQVGPQGDPGPQGRPNDRNVELLIGDPRAAATPAATPSPEQSAPTPARRPAAAPRRPAAASRRTPSSRTAGPQAAPAADRAGGGTMPFTGWAAGSVALAGLGLASAGAVLRRRLRRRGG
jgi:hypothetical protein